MNQTFTPSKHTIFNAGITLWVYVVCLPILAVLLLLPYFRGEQITLGVKSITIVVLFLFFMWQIIMSFKVQTAMKRTMLRIEGERLDGVSYPNPRMNSGTPFSADVSEIVSFAVVNVNTGYFRFFPSLVLNTKSARYTLFAIDGVSEIQAYLREHIPTED